VVAIMAVLAACSCRVLKTARDRQGHLMQGKSEAAGLAVDMYAADNSYYLRPMMNGQDVSTLKWGSNVAKHALFGTRASRLGGYSLGYSYNISGLRAGQEARPSLSD
jgi:hypothetical protein